MTVNLNIVEKCVSCLDVKESYDLAKRMEQEKTNPVLGYRTAGSLAERKTGDMLLKEMKEAWKNLYGSLFKWIVLSGVIGSFIGLIASGFSYAIVWVTSFRQANPMIILGLPLGGLLIVWLYKITGQEKNSGTNLVLTVVRSDEEEVPGWVTPLILISTAITHLFGGSSGREGAALQFGASVGNVCAKYLHLNESDKKIIILASMSAAFSALFGTPMAAVVFPMEVISVGVMYYAALVPCVFSAFAAQGIALLLKVRTVTPPYLVESVPNFYSVDSIKAIILAIACALAGALFCIVLHNGEHYLKKWFPNPYVRVVAGAAGVIILYFALRTDAYLGLGTGVIQASFKETAGPQMFLLKMLFTALTLCAGFKGGEIVPSLFIGATLGSFMSTILAAPTDICAACGMVGVFCSVTNSPITSLLIAAELFGFNGMPFYCIVVAVSYLLSGYYSLYKEQKIVYSKTENKYVDKHTK